MDGLFDFLFNNPFLLLLIIGWLFATFREKPKNEQQQKERQTRQPTQRPAHQSRESRGRTVEDHSRRAPTERGGQPLGKFEVEQKPVVTSHTYEQQTVEDQRLEQLEQLQERLGAHMTQIEDVSGNYSEYQRNEPEIGKPIRRSSPQRVTTSNLSKRFNRQGLVDSIIMAEVLGKPRAKRINHRDHI